MTKSDLLDLLGGCITDQDLFDLYIKISQGNLPIVISSTYVLPAIVNVGAQRGMNEADFVVALQNHQHMENFKFHVTKWAEDRNLILGSDTAKQSLKLLEEAGEVGSALARGNMELLKDAIGDTMVVLTIMDAQIRANQGQASSLRPLVTLLLDAMERASAGAPLNLKCAREVLNTLAQENDLELTECLDQAWNDIKDRRGKMIDGVFVKEADLCKDTSSAQS